MLKVGLFGLGMYSTGRGTNGLGTVLPVLLDLLYKYEIKDITFFASTKESEENSLIDIKNHLKEIKKFKPFIDNLISSYSLSEESLDERIAHSLIEIAIVVTPDHTHYSILDKLANHNVHTMCVKPLTDSLTDAKKITKKFKERELLGAVDFHKRYDAANQILKKEYLSQKIGSLYRVNIDYAQPINIPRDFFKKWVDKSNVFQYLGVHYVDQIFYITNSIPKKVSVFPIKGELFRAIKTYDQINVVIEWEELSGNRFNSFHMTSWSEINSSLYVSKQDIELIGSSGRIKSDQSNRGVSILSESGVEIPNPYFTYDFIGNNNPLDIKGYGIDCIKAFFYEAKKTINKKELNAKNLSDTICTFKDAIVSVACIDAVNHCLKNHLRESEINVGSE